MGFYFCLSPFCLEVQNLARLQGSGLRQVIDLFQAVPG